MVDYYDVLGISRKATPIKIKEAYRKKALEFHPDKNNGVDAKEQFIKIREAYEVLYNPFSRKRYDKHFTQNNKKHSVDNKNTNDWDGSSVKERAQNEAGKYAEAPQFNRFLFFRIGREIFWGICHFVLGLLFDSPNFNSRLVWSFFLTFMGFVLILVPMKDGVGKPDELTNMGYFLLVSALILFLTKIWAIYNEYK